MKWDQNKGTLVFLHRNNPAIQDLIDLLIKARESTIPNAHPYDVHARILNELMQYKTEEKEKIDLINEAIEVVNEGLEYCPDDLEGSHRLKMLQIEILSSIDTKKAEDTARDLLEKNKDGTGYYTLARIEYNKNSDLIKAISFLDKAMSGDKYLSGAIALKIEILLQDKSPDYNHLLELVNSLSLDVNFRETWKSAYHKAVVYTLKGRYENATQFFRMAYLKAPRSLQRDVKFFWMEDGHRKALLGKISSNLTEREGWIYSHGIIGLNDDIFFNPQRQEKKKMLRPGIYVNFELGFSPRGPIAFDVRPLGKE